MVHYAIAFGQTGHANRGQVLGDEVARLGGQPAPDSQIERVVAGLAATMAPDHLLHPARPGVVRRKGKEPRFELRVQSQQIVQGHGSRGERIETLVDERIHLQPQPSGGPRHELPQPRRPRRRDRGRVVVGLDERQVEEGGRQIPPRQFGSYEVFVAAHPRQAPLEGVPRSRLPEVQPPVDPFLDPAVASLGRGQDRIDRKDGQQVARRRLLTRIRYNQRPPGANGFAYRCFGNVGRARRGSRRGRRPSSATKHRGRNHGQASPDDQNPQCAVLHRLNDCSWAPHA